MSQISYWSPVEQLLFHNHRFLKRQKIQKLVARHSFKNTCALKKTIQGDFKKNSDLDIFKNQTYLFFGGSFSSLTALLMLFPSGSVVLAHHRFSFLSVDLWNTGTRWLVVARRRRTSDSGLRRSHTTPALQISRSPTFLDHYGDQSPECLFIHFYLFLKKKSGISWNCLYVLWSFDEFS